MAGAGYKLFNTGDVLTAAQVNTYLQEQTVMVFANSTARTTALSGVLAEGMVSYLQDTNAVEVYNGSAWVGVSGAGDVTEVQAGTGISVASGTGPIPVVTNTMATEITAAGDIVVGTGSGTFDNLPIGTTGQVLTADTTVSPYKVKWAAPAGGGGKVLQVVSTTYSTGVNIASATYTDTGLSLSITPTANTSKILVLCTQALLHTAPGAGNGNGVGWQLLRDSTAIYIPGANAYQAMFCNTYNVEIAHLMNLAYLDSPATTSSKTYKTQARRYVGTGTVYCQESGSTSTMTLLEIGV